MGSGPALEQKIPENIYDRYYDLLIKTNTNLTEKESYTPKIPYGIQVYLVYKISTFWD